MKRKRNKQEVGVRQLLQRLWRERQIASLELIVRSLWEEPAAAAEAVGTAGEGAQETERDQEYHAFLLEAQYQSRVRELLEQAVARSRIVSDAMNPHYLKRLVDEACSEIEAREQEITRHPAALEEIIQPMLRQMIIEEAKLILGWDEVA